MVNISRSQSGRRSSKVGMMQVAAKKATGKTSMADVVSEMVTVDKKQ